MEIATADGFLNVKTLQLEGKKKMPISDLLRGFKLEENNFFV
jgi:methionyl-tRNA formyltransferase